MAGTYCVQHYVVDAVRSFVLRLTDASAEFDLQDVSESPSTSDVLHLAWFTSSVVAVLPD